MVFIILSLPRTVPVKPCYIIKGVESSQSRHSGGGAVHRSEWVLGWDSWSRAESGSVGPGRRWKAMEENTVSWESRGQHQDIALAKWSPSKKQQDRRSWQQNQVSRIRKGSREGKPRWGWGRGPSPRGTWGNVLQSQGFGYEERSGRWYGKRGPSARGTWGYVLQSQGFGYGKRSGRWYGSSDPGLPAPGPGRKLLPRKTPSPLVKHTHLRCETPTGQPLVCFKSLLHPMCKGQSLEHCRYLKNTEWMNKWLLTGS